MADRYTYTLNGKEHRVSISPRDDFRAKGGEKSVYEHHGLAVCVYHNPSNAIPEQKIQELSVLTEPGIQVPLAPLYRKRHVGEVMNWVSDNWVLVELIGNKFRRQHGVTPKDISKVTKQMVAMAKSCHGKSIVMVDPNETNWLVGHDFRVSLIDTSCFQTPSYPGTAIKPAICDYTVNHFDESTDWYSMAVVLAWLWVGIHPYLAYHPKYDGLGACDAMEKRMRAHDSFFMNGTEWNNGCRPLEQIPASLRAWLKAVLQDGERLVAPDDLEVVAEVQVSRRIASTGAVTLTKAGKNVDRHWLEFRTRRGIVLESHLEHEQADVMNKAGDVLYSVPCSGQFESGGVAYYVGNDSITMLSPRDVGNSVRFSVQVVGNAANLPTTKTYRGCVVQNLLGKYLLSIFLKPDECTQIQLQELEGWQILDAKHERGVFVVSAEQGGKYQMLCYQIDNSGHDVRSLCSEYGEVSMCVNENGIAAVGLPDGTLEAFRCTRGHKQIKAVKDAVAGLELFSDGPSIMATDGKDTYKVSLLASRHV